MNNAFDIILDENSDVLCRLKNFGEEYYSSQEVIKNTLFFDFYQDKNNFRVTINL